MQIANSQLYFFTLFQLFTSQKAQRIISHILFLKFLGTIWRFPLLHSHLLKFNSLPLHRVFLEKAREQRARLWAERAGKADVFHEDELKQLFMVLVVKRQPAAHHLVHHHAKTPPVHSTAVVVVLQHLRGRGKRLSHAAVEMHREENVFEENT